MNKREFVAEVARRSELSQADAAKVVDAFLGTVTDRLKEGGEITFSGFGKFSATEKVKPGSQFSPAEKATGSSDFSPDKKVTSGSKVVRSTKGSKKARSTAGSAVAAPPRTRRRVQRQTEGASRAAERTDFAASALGGVTEVARTLRVAKSQPSRWRSGEEQPSMEAAARLMDLDHVLARATLLWDEPLVRVWFESSNPHLDGARPVDVLMTRGSAPVLEALDAEWAGAFA